MVLLKKISKCLMAVSLVLMPVLLSGCAYFTKPSFMQNRDKTYLNARSTQPVRMPPGVTPTAFNETYPIPDRYYPEGIKAVSIVPPGLNS